MISINGVPCSGASCSFSFVESDEPARAWGVGRARGGADFSASLTFVDGGYRRLAAFIRQSERAAAVQRRNARRVGRGARLATRRRQRGEARRLATSHVRDIQRRGVWRIPHPSDAACNMVRARAIARLLAATWVHAVRGGR